MTSENGATGSAATPRWLDGWQHICGWFLIIGAGGGLLLKFGGLAGWCDNPEICGPGFVRPLASDAAIRIADPATGVGIGLLSSLGVIGLFGLAAPFVRGRRWWWAGALLLVVGFATSLLLNLIEALWMQAPWITTFDPRHLIASESQVVVRSAVVLGFGLFLLRPRPSARMLGVGLAIGGGLWLAKIALVVARGQAPVEGWPILLYQTGLWVLLVSAGWITARALRSRDLRPLLLVTGLVVVGVTLEGSLPQAVHGELGLFAVAVASLVAGVAAWARGGGRRRLA
jgi:hypothetical protein